MNTTTVDPLVDILSFLICGTSSAEGHVLSDLRAGRETLRITDTSTVMPFADFRPKKVHVATDLVDEQAQADEDHGRVMTTDPSLLLSTVQDLLGREAEMAFIGDGVVKWTGIRKLNKAPRNIWVSAPGASLYEYHLRIIYANGISSYGKRVAGITKSGKPVKCVVQGSQGSPAANCLTEAEQLVIAASLIEDSARPNVIKATVTDEVSVILPVPMGAHLDLFRLREGPLTPSLRKKALLHWVAKHTRRTRNAEVDVSKHLRGVHKFEIDGLQVQLEA